MNKTLRFLGVLAALATAGLIAFAATNTAKKPAAAPTPEAVIRAAVAAHQPQWPKLDEVRPTPIAGLYEIRIGNNVKYADASGTYVIEGDLIDMKSRQSLTEARVLELSRIDFATLPLKDALVWKNGNGKRQIAVFSDPNCGYCRRFEQRLQEMKDITVYTFIIPILGGDSPEKSRSILCAKDPTATYLGWMLRGEPIAVAPADCKAPALDRNVVLANKISVHGTPAVFLADGNRIPGAVGAVELERRLGAIAAKAGGKS